MFFIDSESRRLIAYHGNNKTAIIWNNSPKVDYIDRGAFFECNHIDKLEIKSKTIRTIEEETFFYSDIDTIILTEFVEQIGQKAFNAKTVLGVPKGTKERFKQLTPNYIFEVEQ